MTTDVAKYQTYRFRDQLIDPLSRFHQDVDYLFKEAFSRRIISQGCVKRAKK